MANDILFKTIMCKGEAGSSIESIEIKSSVGATDIMEITLSDGSKVEFPVTNTLDDNHIKDIIAEVTTQTIRDADENPISGNAVMESKLWQNIGSVAPTDESWTSVSIDVTDYFDRATEFLAVCTLSASDSANINVSILIPNVKITAQTADKQDYIGGYYYSDSYAGSVMARFNRTAKTISILKSWTAIAGSSADLVQFELFYR